MTRLPLYQEAVEALKLLTANNSKAPANCHAGLWYDKYCDVWPDSWGRIAPEGKKDWIASVTAASVGAKPLLKEYLERQQRLAQGHGGQTLRFKADGPFVTGLGREHPMENGFTWHPTLGTPYLPGSSVKGLVRAWAEEWEERKEGDSDLAPRLFGPHGAEAQHDPHAGSVIFLDALPVEPVRLKTEVMTPHYGPWHQCPTEKITQEKAPGDWHSPVPIQYLAVSGQNFLLQFVILPRTAADKPDVDLAARLLENALANIGAGAKTAIGFGRFVKEEAPAEIKAVDHLAEFKQWFDNNKYADPKNKGRQGEVKQRLEQMAADPKTKELVEEAKAYVKTKLKRKECAPAVQAFLYP